MEGGGSGRGGESWCISGDRTSNCKDSKSCKGGEDSLDEPHFEDVLFLKNWCSGICIGGTDWAGCGCWKVGSVGVKVVRVVVHCYKEFELLYDLEK